MIYKVHARMLDGSIQAFEVETNGEQTWRDAYLLVKSQVGVKTAMVAVK